MNIDDLERTPYNKSDNRKIVLVKDFEDDKEYQKARKRKFLRGTLGVVVVIAIIGVMIMIVGAVLHRHTYRSIKTVKQTELAEFKATEYISYAEGVIRYGRNGAEYISNDGRLIWNSPYEMKNPKVFIEGDYAVIADIGGKRFVSCNLKGVQSDVSTAKDIIDADISASGAVCIVADDATANYVNFYNREGDILDIEIKTLFAGDGYPLDMALSPNGQLLMMSYLYMNEGMMLNKVVFYNFSELGQNYVDRLVGVFNYDESMIPVVEVLSDEYACAFSLDKVDFYSLKDSTTPALSKSYEYTEEIRSVFSSGEYVGVISGGNSGIDEDNLDMYSVEGKKISNSAISFDYSDVYMYDDRVVLHNDNYCMVYTVEGSLKYKGMLAGEIDFVQSIKNNRLIQFTDNMMSEIKLKY